MGTLIPYGLFELDLEARRSWKGRDCSFRMRVYRTFPPVAPNQFEAAQVRQGVPKTAFSGKLVMDKSEQMRRIARQGAFLPVTNDSVARS